MASPGFNLRFEDLKILEKNISRDSGRRMTWVGLFPWFCFFSAADFNRQKVKNQGFFEEGFFEFRGSWKKNRFGALIFRVIIRNCSPK